MTIILKKKNYEYEYNVLKLTLHQKMNYIS